MSGLSANQTGSIYGRMFVDEETPFFEKSYLVFIDSSVLPIKQGFNNRSYTNGLKSDLQGGYRVFSSTSKKFGFETLTTDGGSDFFKVGKETRLWTTSSIERYRGKDDVSVGKTIYSDDGAYAGIFTLETK